MIRSLGGKSPKIHPTAFISEAAYLVGDIEVGAYANIWPGVVVRCEGGRAVIGKNVCVQDNTVIHAVGDIFIGDNVAFGHGVICHAERIEGNVLISNGAIINGWVHIGEFTLIAAGAVVPERARIPAYSILMGVPAQVKGQVVDRHLEMMRGVWEPYVKLGQRYKAEGHLEGQAATDPDVSAD